MMHVRARLGVFAGWAMFLAFVVAHILVTPRFAEVYGQVNVEMPGITQLTLAFGLLLERHWFGAIVCVLVFGGALLLYANARAAGTIAGVLATGSAVGAAASTLGLFLPLISLLQGIDKAR